MTRSHFYFSNEESSVCTLDLARFSRHNPNFFKEYVQVKPVLAFASLALKASGKYNEGEFRADSGYLYVNIVYNASICLSLYCLAMFWLSISEDLKPFRSVYNYLSSDKPDNAWVAQCLNSSV